MAVGLLLFAAAFVSHAAAALVCYLSCRRQQLGSGLTAAEIHCDCTGRTASASVPSVQTAPKHLQGRTDLLLAGTAVLCTAVHAVGLFSDNFIVAEGLAACVLAAALALVLAGCQLAHAGLAVGGHKKVSSSFAWCCSQLLCACMQAMQHVDGLEAMQPDRL